ncbi:hypothetical protein IHE45_14G138500 [Dioscorea alata]|uniref:Uncharacterized protein n=1 Tax=Dioscorea alata TaxID=55571 RepID=A0ACB7UVP5_DIOAL|nr:hypothetical protein IHE45_14G138500 [Dioscorea alata]
MFGEQFESGQLPFSGPSSENCERSDLPGILLFMIFLLYVVADLHHEFAHTTSSVPPETTVGDCDLSTLLNMICLLMKSAFQISDDRFLLDLSQALGMVCTLQFPHSRAFYIRLEWASRHLAPQKQLIRWGYFKNFRV